MDYEQFRKLALQQGIPGVSPVKLATIPGTEYTGYVNHPDQAVLDNIAQTQQQATAQQQVVQQNQPQPRQRGGIIDAITKPIEYITSGDWGDDLGQAVGGVVENPLSPSAWFNLPVTAARGIEGPLTIPLDIAKESVGHLIYMGAKQDLFMNGVMESVARMIPGVGQSAAAFMSFGAMLPEHVQDGIVEAHDGDYNNFDAGIGVWEYMQSHLDDLPAPVRYPLRIGIELAFDPLTWTGIGAARNATKVGKLGRIGRTADEYNALSIGGKVRAQMSDAVRDPVQGADAVARSLGVISDTMFIKTPVGAVRGAIRHSPLSPLLDRSQKSIEGEFLRRQGDDLVTSANAIEGTKQRPGLAQNETPMSFRPNGDMVPTQSMNATPWKGSPLIDNIGDYDAHSGRNITTPIGNAVPGAKTFKIVHPNSATAERYSVVDNKTGVEFRVDRMYNEDVIVSSSVDQDKTFASVDDAFNYLYGRINRGGGQTAPPPPTGPATPPQPTIPTGPASPVIDPVGPIDAPGPADQNPPTGGMVEPQPTGPATPPQPTGPMITPTPTGSTPPPDVQQPTQPVVDQPTADVPAGPEPTGDQGPAIDYPSGPDQFDGGGESGPQIPSTGQPDAIFDEKGKNILKPKAPKKTGGPVADPIIPEMEGVHRQFQVYPHLNRAVERVYAASKKAIDAGKPDPYVGFWRDYAAAVTPYGRLVDDAVAEAKGRKFHGVTEPQAIARAMGSFQVERLANVHGTPLPSAPYIKSEGSDIIWRRHSEPSNQLLKSRITPEEYKIIRRDLPLIYEEALMTTDEARAKALINATQSVPGIRPHKIDADDAERLLTGGFRRNWRDIQDIDGRTLEVLDDLIMVNEAVEAPRLLSALRAAIREERRNYTRQPFIKETPAPFFAQGRSPGGRLDPMDWRNGPSYMPQRGTDDVIYDGQFRAPDDGAPPAGAYEKGTVLDRVIIDQGDRKWVETLTYTGEGPYPYEIRSSIGGGQSSRTEEAARKKFAQYKASKYAVPYVDEVADAPVVDEAIEEVVSPRQGAYWTPERIAEREAAEKADPRKPRYFREPEPDDFDGYEWDNTDSNLPPNPDGFYMLPDDPNNGFNADFRYLEIPDLRNTAESAALAYRAGGREEEMLNGIVETNKKLDRARSEKTKMSLDSKLEEQIEEFWDHIESASYGTLDIRGTAREIEEEIYRLRKYEPKAWTPDPFDVPAEPVVNDGSVDRVEELMAREMPPEVIDGTREVGGTTFEEPDVEAIAAADAADTELAPVAEIEEAVETLVPAKAAPVDDGWKEPKLKRFRIVVEDDDDAQDIVNLVNNYLDSDLVPAGIKVEFDDARTRLISALSDEPMIKDRVNTRIDRLNEIITRIDKTNFDKVAARDANVLTPKYRNFLASKPEPVAKFEYPDNTPVKPKTEDDAVKIITEIVEAAEEAKIAPKKRGRPRKTPVVDPIDDPKKPLPEPTPELAKTIDPVPVVKDTEIKDETMAAVIEAASKKKGIPPGRKPSMEPGEKLTPTVKANVPPGDGATPPPAGPTEPSGPAPIAWEGERRPWNIVDRLYEAQIIDDEAVALLNTEVTVTDLPNAKKGRAISVADYYLVQRQLLGDKNKAINVTQRMLRDHYQKTGVIRKDWAPKKLRKLLDAYDAATANIRERVLMNQYTAPMIIGLNVAGNFVQTAMEGNWKQAVDQSRPSYIRAAYRAIAENKMSYLYDTGPGKYFQDMGSNIGRDISINLVREGSAYDGDFAFTKMINQWAGENAKKARNMKRVLNTAGVRGSEFMFHLHGAVELSARMVNAEKHAREVAYAPRLEEFVNQIKAQYTKTGRADDLIDGLLKSGRNFSPDDVRTYALKHGYSRNEAVDLGQNWKRQADDVMLEGKKYADKVLFSYEYTNADDLMRKVFMFHYWYMRASARYTRAIVRNPYIMVNYQRAIEGLERESEGEPNAVRGMIKAFSGPGGFIIWVDPVKAVATAASFKRQAVEDGDEKRFDSFMSQSGMFLNPMLQAALAVVGISDNEGIDPTGSGPVRRVLGVPINLAVSQFGGTYRGVPFQDAVGNTVQMLSGIIRDENTYHSSDATNRVMIRNEILDAVMGKYGIAQGTPLAEWDREAVNELELELSNFDSGVPSEITNDAYRAWARAKALQVGVALTVPVGTSLRSETRDERLNINREEPFDETPTEGELQITQSSEDAMPLTLRNEQFKSLFPSGELGRVDVSPVTGETQEQVLAAPEMAVMRSFKDWQSRARNFGPAEFRAYMMQVSPAYRDYINQIPDEYKVDPERFDAMSVSYQAFLAANGKRGSMYDRQPRNASEPTAVDPSRQLFAWMEQNGYSQTRRPYNPFPL